MKTYVVTRETLEGEIQVPFKCDYDLGDALNQLGVDFLGGLIGIKSARGSMKWYRSGIRRAGIVAWREEPEYASGTD